MPLIGTPNTSKLIFHSDQGVQYSAKVFRDKLTLLNITQSMSRKENFWDNGIMGYWSGSLEV